MFITSDASPWTAKMPSSVAGLIGSCVVIPCSFNYPEHENKVTKFTGIWTERTGHIIYHPVQSKVMQQYRDRTVLLGDLSKKDCSLKIDPIQSSDTGTFHFRIEMEGYEKYSYKQSEVSISLTSNPAMLRVPEAATINVKEDVEQGETVSASCSAFHSCPTNSPVFIWSHSGKMHVQSKGLDNGQWQVTSSLTFHPTRADHSKPLECTVTYQGGQQMNSSKILNVKCNSNKTWISPLDPKPPYGVFCGFGDGTYGFFPFCSSHSQHC
uniref:Ig-like domain-containing protein n=1 Tax=Myripristis murdjan TaxID=586833 RepID=A0A667Z8I2_9TELE